MIQHTALVCNYCNEIFPVSCPEDARDGIQHKRSHGYNLDRTTKATMTRIVGPFSRQLCKGKCICDLCGETLTKRNWD